MMKRCIFVLLLTLALGMSQSGVASTTQINDKQSLTGVKNARGLFDINVSDPNKLGLYLQVIGETHEGLLRQGAKPDFIIAFRGASVKLVSRNRDEWTPEQQKVLAATDKTIAALAAKGVRFEACAVATRLFEVSNDSLLPEVTLVGNTFISLIGYQAKGYALIPIQ